MADSPAAAVPAELPTAEQQEEKVVEETPGIKLFAGNLSYSIRSEQLKAFIARAVQETDILSCEVIFRGTRPAGYGFVAVSTDDAARKAIDALNGQEFEERKVIVEHAKPIEEKEKEKSERKAKRRSGRRGSKAVTGEVTEAEANGEAEKPVTVTDAEGENKPKKKKKKSNAKKLRNKVKDAITPGENGIPAENAEGAFVPAAEGERKKTPRAKRTPKPRRAVGEEPNGEQSKTTLFVANLPFSLEEDGLAEIFKEFSVNSVHIVRKRWGHPRRSKGYGFVELADEANQKKALQKSEFEPFEADDEKTTEKRKLAVKIAVNAAHDDSDAEKAAGETGEGPATGEPATETMAAAAPAA